MKYSLDNLPPIHIPDYARPTPLPPTYAKVALGIVALAGCMAWPMLILAMGA